jgi:hypothetical protein
MVVRNIALVSESNQVKQDELAVVASALQLQILRDFGPAWGITATVDAFARLGHVPPTYYPMIVRDDIGIDAAGIHLDRDLTPFALIEASNRWSLTASHEALEMLGDKFGNELRVAASVKPDQGEVEYLVEVCDPSEAVPFSYRINGVVVSDFYLPSFFDPVTNPRATYSFTGAITRPLEVLPGGYLSWRDPTTRVWWQQRWFGTRGPTFHELGLLEGQESPRRFTDSAVMKTRDEAVAGVADGTEEHDLLVAAYALATEGADAAQAHAERLHEDIGKLIAK